MKNKVDISIVVPVFNEVENVDELYREIKSVLAKMKVTWEIIFVDDGSNDGTIDSLRKLKPITVIRMRRNMGQSAALDRGLKKACGKLIVTMDGDGQNDPGDIPLLLDELNKGGDVVCGWRHQRKDNAAKRYVSLGAKYLRSILVDDGVHDAGCTLRIYKKECFEDLDLYGEMHRMIPALLKWRGFEVKEIRVNHRARKFGKTKYNWFRVYKGLLDMVEVWFWRKYDSRPLHLFGGLGLVALSISSLLLMTLALLRMFYGYELSNKIWPLVGVAGFLAGIQLIGLGILANMLLRSRKSNENYSIKEIIENE